MTRRAKRPSVKGMGADIFFSEVPSPSVPEGQGPTVHPEMPSRARKQASLPAARPATLLELGDVERAIVQDALSRVAEAGRITASFRFTKTELDALDDLVYRARKRHGLRIPKQEIVRLGLASLLSEYKARGDESILGHYIMRLKES